MATKYRRRIAQNLGLSLIALLMTLALAEAALRILDPDTNPSPSWHYDRDLGWVQNPGHSYDYVVAGEEVHVAYNRAGFRDAERARERPADVRRVEVIGDSFSAAVEVNLEDTFSHRLESILNARTGERWEVINLGVGDFGTAQEWLLFERLGLAFEPDIVLHQIFPLNDICNNSLALAGLCKSKKDPYRPYFVEVGDGLRLTSPQPLRGFLRRRLASYRLIEKAYRRQYYAEGGESVTDAEHRERMREAGLPPLTPILYTFVEDAQQIEPISQGWRVTERLIERFASRCRELDIEYVPVVIPFHVRVGELWQRFADMQPPPPMIQDYPERRLGRLFGRLGVPGVMMKGIFEERPELFFPDRGGHLNPAAHWLTAKAVYTRLRDAAIVNEDPDRAGKLKGMPRTGRASQEYRWGSVLRLGLDEETWYFLGEGWSQPDEGFHWTIGEKATLALGVPTPPMPVLLKARLSAFLSPGKVDRQRVRVLVNGRSAGEWTVSQPGFHEQTLLIQPTLFYTPDRTVLAFETPDAVSPSAVGGSSDPRTLGIALASVVLQTQAPDVEFVAAPNPVQVCDGSGQGVVTLSWQARGRTSLEVHVGSPSGPLFTRQGSEGSERTDKWVTDGLVFYLQDTSSGKPLEADHTLATLTVKVTDAGCPN